MPQYFLELAAGDYFHEDHGIVVKKLFLSSINKNEFISALSDSLNSKGLGSYFCTDSELNPFVNIGNDDNNLPHEFISAYNLLTEVDSPDHDFSLWIKPEIVDNGPKINLVDWFELMIIIAKVARPDMTIHVVPIEFIFTGGWCLPDY